MRRAATLLASALAATQGWAAPRLVDVQSCVWQHDRCQFKAVAQAAQATTPRKVHDGTPDPHAEQCAAAYAERALRYFQELGVPQPQLLRRAPLHVVVGARVPGTDRESTPAAFYLSDRRPADAPLRRYLGSAAQRIAVGYSPSVNAAYLEDVMIHETVHAVLDRGQVTPAWRIVAGVASNRWTAWEEAIADYFAAVITGDPRIGEGLGVPRNLAAHEPRTFHTGDAHADGQSFARALWQTRDALSAPLAQRLDRAIIHVARRGLARWRSLEEFLGALAPTLGDAALAAALRTNMIYHGALAAERGILDITLATNVGGPSARWQAPGRARLAARTPAAGVQQFHVQGAPGQELRLSYKAQVVDTLATAAATTPPRLEVWVRFGAPFAARTPPSLRLHATPVASFALPPRAHDAYFMIVNLGAHDAAYHNLVVMSPR